MFGRKHLKKLDQLLSKKQPNDATDNIHKFQKSLNFIILISHNYSVEICITIPKINHGLEFLKDRAIQKAINFLIVGLIPDIYIIYNK